MANTRIHDASLDVVPNKLQTGSTLPVNPQHPMSVNAQEVHRWDVQHEVMKRSTGGLYDEPELVRAALAPREGGVARVLDVGTGTGLWAAEMAKEHPECEVIGIDLVLPASESSPSLPKNLVLQVGDANLPLRIDTASVDFVHARMVDAGIRNYPQWLSEVARVLRPNGVYFAYIGRLEMVGEGGITLPTANVGEEGYSGVQSMLSAADNSLEARQYSKRVSEDWTKLMKENGNFDRVGGNKDRLHPVGLWKEGVDENSRIASELLTKDVLLILETFKPMLVNVGHNEELVNRWHEDARRELSDPNFKVSARWSWAWCVRSADEWRSPA